METVKAKVVEVAERPKMPTVWVAAYMRRHPGGNIAPYVSIHFPTVEDARRYTESSVFLADVVGTIRIIEIPGEA